MTYNFKILGLLLLGLITLIIGSTTDYFGQIFPDLSNSQQDLAKDNNNNLNNQSSVSLTIKNFDIVVYGDELQGICAAIWAKKTLGDEGKVALVRSNSADKPLGGLLTRGGLAFLDYDKTNWYNQPVAQCFRDFLNRAKVVVSCLAADRAQQAMEEMLAEAGVSIIHESPLIPQVENQAIQYVDVPQSNVRLQANSYIDATQDAELARKAGLAYYRGYESQSPELANETLSVSLVPLITGLTIADLRAIESQIFSNGALMNQIETSIRENTDAEGARFWLSNFRVPLYQSSPDGYYHKSIAFGVAYKLHRNLPFGLEGFFLDRSNICLLPDNSLSWNGLLFKYQVEQLLQIEENGRRPTQEMQEEMVAFEAWLQELSGKEDVRVIIPQEIYIRHTLSIKDVIDPLTGQEILKGGTKPENSIGSFSYNFDLRGGVNGLSISIPPIPVYNFGIENTLARDVNNLAIVGRSSGYVGMAVSVGRIQTVNIYQGQGVGIAAGIAKQLGVPLNSITSPQVRKTIENLTGLTTQLYGKDTTQGVDYRNIK
ncbi:MAG: FAD-dependent oxidoreductase [Symploca sp. SIO2G7]|nr:FAD-dependent oxidoreductase [Symploca sp. SIO2G7]